MIVENQPTGYATYFNLSYTRSDYNSSDELYPLKNTPYYEAQLEALDHYLEVYLLKMDKILKSYPEIGRVLNDKRREATDYEPLRVTEDDDIKLCSPKQEAIFYKEQLEVVIAKLDENIQSQRDDLEVEAQAELRVEAQAELRVETQAELRVETKAEFNVQIESKVNEMKATLDELTQQLKQSDKQKSLKKSSSFFPVFRRSIASQEPDSSDVHHQESAAMHGV